MTESSGKVSALSIFDRHLTFPSIVLDEAEFDIRLLQKDILTIFDVIKDEKRSSSRLVAAAAVVMRTRRSASIDDLHAIRHKLDETTILLHKNALYLLWNKRKMEVAAKNNPEVTDISSFSPNELQRRLLRPEHFRRPHGRSVPVQSSVGRAGRPTGLGVPPGVPPVATTTSNRSSPWEGSEFKVKLLVSLKDKLYLSLYFHALRTFSQAKVSARQAAFTCHRVRTKRLLRCCFGSLLFECISSKFIISKADVTVRKYIRRRIMSPALLAFGATCTMHSSRRKRQISNMIAAEKYHCRATLLRGMSKFRMFLLRRQRLESLKSWAHRSNELRTKSMAWAAWTVAFVNITGIKANLSKSISTHHATEEGTTDGSEQQQASSANLANVIVSLRDEYKAAIHQVMQSHMKLCREELAALLERSYFLSCHPEARASSVSHAERTYTHALLSSLQHQATQQLQTQQGCMHDCVYLDEGTVGVASKRIAAFSRVLVRREARVEYTARAREIAQGGMAQILRVLKRVSGGSDNSSRVTPGSHMVGAENALNQLIAAGNSGGGGSGGAMSFQSTPLSTSEAFASAVGATSTGTGSSSSSNVFKLLSSKRAHVLNSLASNRLPPSRGTNGSTYANVSVSSSSSAKDRDESILLDSTMDSTHAPSAAQQESVVWATVLGMGTDAGGLVSTERRSGGGGVQLEDSILSSQSRSQSQIPSHTQQVANMSSVSFLSGIGGGPTSVNYSFVSSKERGLMKRNRQSSSIERNYQNIATTGSKSEPDASHNLPGVRSDVSILTHTHIRTPIKPILQTSHHSRSGVARSLVARAMQFAVNRSRAEHDSKLGIVNLNDSGSSGSGGSSGSDSDSEEEGEGKGDGGSRQSSGHLTSQLGQSLEILFPYGNNSDDEVDERTFVSTGNARRLNETHDSKRSSKDRSRSKSPLAASISLAARTRTNKSEAGTSAMSAREREDREEEEESRKMANDAYTRAGGLDRLNSIHVLQSNKALVGAGLVTRALALASTATARESRREESKRTSYGARVDEDVKSRPGPSLLLDPVVIHNRASRLVSVYVKSFKHWLRLSRASRHGIMVAKRVRYRTLLSTMTTWAAHAIQRHKYINSFHNVFKNSARRRVLRKLFRESITRLRPRSMAVTMIVRSGLKRETFNAWMNALLRYRIIHNTVERSRLKSLQIGIAKFARNARILLKMRKAANTGNFAHPRILFRKSIKRWTLWCSKVQLLRRVFRVAERAWDHNLSCLLKYMSSTFDVKYSILLNWRSAVRVIKENKRDALLNAHAVAFRDASAKANSFINWLAFTATRLIYRRSFTTLFRLKFRRAVRRSFKRLINFLEAGSLHGQRCDHHMTSFKLRKFLTKWHIRANYRYYSIPQQHFANKCLGTCFERWRVLRRVEDLEKMQGVRGRWGKYKLRKRFILWKQSVDRRNNRRRAAQMLLFIIWKRVIRGVLLKWPGFFELKKALQFKIRHGMRSKRTAHLVDAPPPPPPRSKEEADRQRAERMREAAVLPHDKSHIPGTSRLPMAHSRGIITGQTEVEGDVAIASFLQRKTRLPILARAAQYGFFDESRILKERSKKATRDEDWANVVYSSTSDPRNNRLDYYHNSTRDHGEEDYDPHRTLLNVLVTVLRAWNDVAFRMRRARDNARVVRFNHESKLLFTGLLLWAKSCSITAHRNVTWTCALRGSCRRPTRPAFDPFFVAVDKDYKYSDGFELIRWFDTWDINKKKPGARDGADSAASKFLSYKPSLTSDREK